MVKLKLFLLTLCCTLTWKSWLYLCCSLKLRADPHLNKFYTKLTSWKLKQVQRVASLTKNLSKCFLLNVSIWWPLRKLTMIFLTQMMKAKPLLSASSIHTLIIQAKSLSNSALFLLKISHLPWQRLMNHLCRLLDLLLRMEASKLMILQINFLLKVKCILLTTKRSYFNKMRLNALCFLKISCPANKSYSRNSLTLTTKSMKKRAKHSKDWTITAL